MPYGIYIGIIFFLHYIYKKYYYLLLIFLEKNHIILVWIVVHTKVINDKSSLSPTFKRISYAVKIGLKKAVISYRKLKLKKAVIPFRNMGLKNGEMVWLSRHYA